MKKLFTSFSWIIRHPLARGSAVVFLGSMVANVMAYAYHLVVGRMLGPVRYGELASLVSFSYILNVPAIVLQTVLTRYIAGYKARHEVGRAKDLAITVTRWVFIASIIGTLLLLPFLTGISQFLRLSNPSVVLYIFLTSALLMFGTVQTSLLQGFQLFFPAMVYANIGAVLRLVGGAIGALFGVTETVVAGVATNVVGYFLFLIPLGFVLKANSKPSNIPIKEAAIFAIPTMLSILGVTSLYSTDIMLAKHFLSEFDAGMYAALSVMGKIIFFASSSVVYVLFPVIAERTKQKVSSNRLVYASLAAVLAVSGSITLGYFLFPKIALHLLFGPLYYPAAASLGIFGVFITFFSLANVLVTTLLGRGNTSVWWFVAAAALVQIGVISIAHQTIATIILVNLIVSAALFTSLLLYYTHVSKKH